MENRCLLKIKYNFNNCCTYRHRRTMTIVYLLLCRDLNIFILGSCVRPWRHSPPWEIISIETVARGGPVVLAASLDNRPQKPKLRIICRWLMLRNAVIVFMTVKRLNIFIIFFHFYNKKDASIFHGRIGRQKP